MRARYSPNQQLLHCNAPGNRTVLKTDLCLRLINCHVVEEGHIFVRNDMHRTYIILIHVNSCTYQTVDSYILLDEFYWHGPQSR